MEPGLPFIIRQFILMMPVLFVCVLVMTYACMRLSRHRKAARLVLAGAGVLLLKGIVVIGGQAILHQATMAGGAGDPETFAKLSLGLSILGILGEMLGISLLVWAAFAGRTAPEASA